MRLSRIHTDRPLESGAEFALDERAGRYVTQVLRLRSGDSLVLFNGDGRDLEAELTACDRRTCRVRVGNVLAREAPAPLHLHLGIGISRGERMDLAIQKSVELGVQEISPLSTARNVVQLRGEREERRVAHWQGVVISACEQSGRSLLPTVHAPQALAEWLDRHPDGLVLHHAADDTLATLPPPGPVVNLLIGPEGGLSADERALALRAGYRAVRLGPRVLRTETAPLAAIAAIQALWGDFR